MDELAWTAVIINILFAGFLLVRKWQAIFRGPTPKAAESSWLCADCAEPFTDQRVLQLHRSGAHVFHTETSSPMLKHLADHARARLRRKRLGNLKLVSDQ